MIRTGFAMTTLGALVACASALPGEVPASGMALYAGDARLGAPVRQVCFASSIDGFSLNERDTVLLHEGGDRFMVEVFGACQDLEFAQTLGVDATTGCLGKGDALIVADTLGGSGFGSRRCLVKEIRAWDRKALQPDQKPAGT